MFAIKSLLVESSSTQPLLILKPDVVTCLA